MSSISTHECLILSQYLSHKSERLEMWRPNTKLRPFLKFVHNVQNVQNVQNVHAEFFFFVHFVHVFDVFHFLSLQNVQTVQTVHFFGVYKACTNYFFFPNLYKWRDDLYKFEKKKIICTRCTRVRCPDYLLRRTEKTQYTSFCCPRPRGIFTLLFIYIYFLLFVHFVQFVHFVHFVHCVQT